MPKIVHPMVDLSGKLRFDNPSINYDFIEGDNSEEGFPRMGKMSVVSQITERTTKRNYVAKTIYYDDDIKFAEREYKLMKGISERGNGKDDKEFFKHAGFVQIHEAFLLRKYMVIIMEEAEGTSILDYVVKRATYTEDNACKLISDILKALEYCHALNVVHLDIRPSNIRVSKNHVVKIVDYNSARELANKKAGAVVDVIGDTEFCGPEMLEFDPVTPTSDVWGVGVILYILLTGISPFYYEKESDVLAHVTGVKYDQIENGLITAEAKVLYLDKKSRFFTKSPNFDPNSAITRASATQALALEWFDDEKMQTKRKAKDLTLVKDDIAVTHERLMTEEAEEYVCCSGTLRTFEEEEFVSPEESCSEEE